MDKRVKVCLFLVLAAQWPASIHSVEDSSEGECTLVFRLVRDDLCPVNFILFTLFLPTNAGCLHGFPAAPPTDGWQHIPTGEAIFGDLRFQCSGRVHRIEMMLFFVANFGYNASLQCDLTLWQANGSHYRRSDEDTFPIVVSLASLSLNPRDEASVIFETSINASFRMNVTFPVKAGYILGLSCPPNTSDICNHIPLAARQDAGSPLIQLTADNCFSPAQGCFPCPRVVQMIRPAIQVDFVRDGDVNSGAASGEFLGMRRTIAHYTVAYCYMLIVAMYKL